MNRALFHALALVVSLSGAVSAGGCKSEPPPPEEPSFEGLREKLDSTKKDMADAHKRVKEAVEKARAERLAKQAAASGESPESDSGAAPAH